MKGCDEPLALLLDQCGGPARVNLERQATPEFELVIRTAESDRRAAATVDDRQLIDDRADRHTIHDALIPLHHPVVVRPDTVMAATYRAVHPGHDHVLV